MNYLKKIRNRNILIVDDETEILDLLKNCLESQSWKVITVDSPSQAFKLLKKEVFFLILMDIAMPEMDGYEFINKIKEKGITSQIVLMTGFGYNPKHTLIKVKKKGEFPVIFKPLDLKKPRLKETVQTAWRTYHKDI